jgi:hypothetical protein
VTDRDTNKESEREERKRDRETDAFLIKALLTQMAVTKIKLKKRKRNKPI